MLEIGSGNWLMSVIESPPMQIIKINLTLMFFAALATSQRKGPPPEKLVATSAEIEAMAARAKAERKPDQAEFAVPLVTYNPFRGYLQYRAVIGPAAVHAKEAELFVVVDGSGTLVMGGKLVNEKSNGDNLTGTDIEGGSARPIAKGDVFIVPENTPHWFSKINATLILMAFHLPHSGGGH